MITSSRPEAEDYVTSTRRRLERAGVTLLRTRARPEQPTEMTADALTDAAGGRRRMSRRLSRRARSFPCVEGPSALPRGLLAMPTDCEAAPPN